LPVNPVWALFARFTLVYFIYLCLIALTGAVGAQLTKWIILHRAATMPVYLATSAPLGKLVGEMLLALATLPLTFFFFLWLLSFRIWQGSLLGLIFLMTFALGYFQLPTWLFFAFTPSAIRGIGFLASHPASWVWQPADLWLIHALNMVLFSILMISFVVLVKNKKLLTNNRL
jgi:hypothetical protein